MSDSIAINEPLLLETLRNVVEPALEDVKVLLARGDSESGVIHEYRYEAIKLLTTLATTLLGWYEDCEGPFIVGEVLVGWKREAAQVGGDELNRVPSSPLGTFTSITFTVTIAKVMLMYGMASYDAQETLAGYKAVEQACALLERVQETGSGISLHDLTAMCSLSRRQYITAGAPSLIFGGGSNSDDSSTTKKVRKSLAGGTLLLDCYVYMCMAWGRWNNVDHVSMCLHAATELATDLVHRRDKFSRDHKQNKIDQIITSNSQESEKVEQMRSVQEDSQRRAIEERIRAKKAKAAAAKAGGVAATSGASSPTTDVPSSATPTSKNNDSSPQYLYCFTTTDASSGCAMKVLSWSWSALATEHTASLSTCSPIPEIRQLAKTASESAREATTTSTGGGDAGGSVLIQSSELLGWLHMGLLETEEAVRSGEARLLTASAHANKAANSITATMFCHKSLSHQIGGNLLKSPQDVEDWVFAALNLAEFYLSKVDLSHLEHCLLAVDSLIMRANLYVPGDQQQATTNTIKRDITGVWSSFDLLQYRYLWASLHHHLLLLSQNAMSFVTTHPPQHLSATAPNNTGTSGGSDVVPKYPTSDAVISVLQRGVIWVKCRLFQNPLLLPEGIRNLPSDERDQYILENVTGPGAGSITNGSLVTAASSTAQDGGGSGGSWGMEERIPFGVSGVPPPRTHMLIALPRAAITHHNNHKAKHNNNATTTVADDPITTLSHHFNSVLSTAPAPHLTSIAYFNGCGWPTVSSTDVSRISATRPEVADQVVAKFLVGALRHIHRMQDQLLHHSTAATELASVEADFEKFLLFRRMESDGWLVQYLTSQLPILASLTSSPTTSSTSTSSDPTTTTTAAGCSFTGHYILGPDPSFPGEFSIRQLKIDTLPSQRDTTFLQKRLACIRKIYDTELNPKAYRNVVRQADYDCGWSCLEVAIETTEAIKMHTALTSGEAETDTNTKKLAALKETKSKFLDRSLTHFKEFVTGFYTEISVATKAGKQASDALEPSDFPTLFVGEMRIVEVLLKQGRIPDAINRLSNHALQFLRQNPSVLREYPELNANKQQCEELLGLLQQEVLKNTTSTSTAAVEEALIVGGDVHLSTRPYISSSKPSATGGGKKVTTGTSNKKQ